MKIIRNLLKLAKKINDLKGLTCYELPKREKLTVTSNTTKSNNP